jgi:apolipoprotein N-acyltransferase
LAARRNRKDTARSAALRAPSETTTEARRRFLRAMLLPGLCALGVVLLSASFAPWDLWPVAYVALVPWVAALTVVRSRRWTIAIASLAGMAFWAGNLYWLSWVTLPGYLAAVFYLTAYWVVAAMVLRWTRQQRRPSWLALPLVWTALEYARAHVIGGFPWFYLAQTQYTRVPLIQIADVTGQYGVSFFVAMVNGAVLDVIAARRAGPERPSDWSPPAGVIASLLLAAGMMGYGYWRVGQDVQSPGPTIGVVQRAVPNRLTGAGPGAVEIFNRHYRSSLELDGRDCDLIVWPEAVLPRGVNDTFLAVAPGDGETFLQAMGMLFGDDLVAETRASTLAFNWELMRDGQLLPVLWRDRAAGDVPRGVLRRWVDRYAPGGMDTSHMSRAQLERHWKDLARGILPDGSEFMGLSHYGQRVAALTEKLDCPLLIGAGTFHYDPDEKRWGERNSALWFDVGGHVQGEYAKMHLVPFSEFVPFRKSWPWLHRTLRACVPDVMPQLEPGEEVVRFRLQRRSGVSWRVVTPICYEGTFGRVCRDAVIDDGKKAADVMVNLSNDGWFVWPGERIRQSTEHAQHLAHYVFRAVETRVPVVRSVNTGISASIDSNGRVERKLEKESGVLVANVLVDSRTSLYSIAGDGFAVGVCALAVVFLGWTAWRSRAQSGGGTIKE